MLDKELDAFKLSNSGDSTWYPPREPHRAGSLKAGPSTTGHTKGPLENNHATVQIARQWYTKESDVVLYTANLSAIWASEMPAPNSVVSWGLGDVWK